MVDINKYVGQIVTLDLVNGKEITTRIKSIKLDIVSCSKPLIFIPIQDDQNPGNTRVISIPYGHPLYEVDDIELNINHIITIFKPSQAQQDSYATHTSSVVTAPAGALNDLPDLSKFKI